MKLNNIQEFLNTSIKKLEKENMTDYVKGMLTAFRAIKKVVDFQDSLEQVLG